MTKSLGYLVELVVATLVYGKQIFSRFMRVLRSHNKCVIFEDASKGVRRMMRQHVLCDGVRLDMKILGRPPAFAMHCFKMDFVV